MKPTPNNMQFDDPMMAHLQQASQEFLSIKNRGKGMGHQKKFSGQAILEIDKYMRSKHPEYVREIRVAEVMAYFTDAEMDLLAQIAEINPDKGAEMMVAMLVKRIRGTKLVMVRQVQAKVPAIANYLKEQIPETGQRTSV